MVDKMRDVYLIDNVRVHFDQVKDLGTFIEFEAVYEEKSPTDKEREVKKVSALMDTFKIQKEDLLDRSYIDYLLGIKEEFENLKVLYSFENSVFIISEFEKIDVTESLDPEKKFFWLIFNKNDKSLERLEFLSRGTSEGIEKRNFNKGHLKFSSTEAFFKNGQEEWKLYTQKVFSDDYKKEIVNYFNG